MKPPQRICDINTSRAHLAKEMISTMERGDEYLLMKA